MTKFVQPRPYAGPEAAARKLMEIANFIEPVRDGRIHIEKINWPFLQEHRGSPAEYNRSRLRNRARLAVAARERHEVHPGRLGPVHMTIVLAQSLC
jgi:hypothetical protein